MESVFRHSFTLPALMAVQAACALFFVYDLSHDLIEGKTEAGSFYLMMETLATVSLLIAIAFEWRVFQVMQADRQAARRLKKVATGKVSQLLKEYFASWGLTPAESDVAELTIKGCSIGEIALLRESREGTIKAHLNAIYRKSGTAGRVELVSLIIEDLMTTPLIGQPSSSTSLGSH